MIDLDAVEAEASLKHIRRLCRILCIGLRVIFGLICVYWVFVVVAMIISIVNPESMHTSENVSGLSVVLYLSYGLIIGALFIIFTKIFSSTAEGESPFTITQVKRLRLISILLLAYAVFDTVIAYNTTMLQLEVINSGYVSTSGSAIVAVNFAPFIAAAVVFAFSFVFKYGVLLQEFSDDTI